MESWQQLRLARAKSQDIYIARVLCEDDSFLFLVQGLTDVYTVTISESIDLWPPRCDCEDNFWRPDVLCKHCLVCLLLMGVEEALLEDMGWEPEQSELYEILSNAPDCVGGRLYVRTE